MKNFLIASFLLASTAQAESFFFPKIDFLSIKNTPENAQAFCSMNGYSYAESSDFTFAHSHEKLVDTINEDRSFNTYHCIMKAENCEILQSVSCQ